MEITTGSIRHVAERCRALISSAAGVRPTIGYPASLALCLIDAVYSTGSHPAAVDNIIDRYVFRHGCADGAKSLRYSIAAAGGERAWAESVAHNLKPANTHPGAPLKAEVVNRATRLMADLDIETVPDLREAVSACPHDNEVIRRWRALPSQSSGVTYFHLLALAGVDHFEADRAVLRFLADGCEDGALTPGDARRLVAGAADILALDVPEAGRMVWQAAHRRLPSSRKSSVDLAGAFVDVNG